MPTLTPQQNCFLKLSENVWNRRGYAKSHGLPMNEETLSEMTLMDLNATYPGIVSIQAFSKSAESKNGADWAWAFVGPDSRTNVAMLVQAKRLDNRDQDYRGLYRKIGEPPIPPEIHQRQIDVLIGSSRSTYGFPAVYAFYNHLTIISRVPENCGSISMAQSGQFGSWGISIALAQTVRTVTGKDEDESFDSHASHSIPFHCLLCPRRASRRNPDTPMLVADALNSLRAGSTLAAAFAMEGMDTTDLIAPSENLHPMFAEVMRIASIDNPADRDGFGSMLGKQYPGIAGVVIIQDYRG